MSDLLEWKEKLQTLYAKYSVYIDKGIRFILALMCFLMIGSNIGFMQKLANPVISVGLALVCAFLPMIITVLAAAGLMLVHIFSASMGMAIIVAIVFLVMFIFYFRMTPKKAIVLLLTPLAFAFKVPVLIPIAYGLVGTPIFIVPVACGTMVYFLVDYAKSFATTINSTKKANLMGTVTRFAKQIFQSKEMWVVIAAVVICLLLVYTLRRISMKYAWETAIASGAAAYILIMIVGDFALDVNVKYAALIFGTVVAVVLAFGLELMVFSVDYARTEYLQFEDDEYYYYVKALPKVSVSAPEKKVKRINERQETGRMEPVKEFHQTSDDEIDKMIEKELLKN